MHYRKEPGEKTAVEGASALLPIALQFHRFIEKNNVLEYPTKVVHEYLKKHPVIFKVVLVASHIFRALTMLFFMSALPYSTFVNTTICLAASLVYRLTIETNCAYKLSLPSFGGAIAFSLSKKARADSVSRAAFSSLKDFAFIASNVFPIVMYVIYITLTVSYDVDKNCFIFSSPANSSCC